MQNKTIVDFDIANSFVVDFDVLKSGKEKIAPEIKDSTKKEKKRELEVVLEIYKI